MKLYSENVYLFTVHQTGDCWMSTLFKYVSTTCPKTVCFSDKQTVCDLETHVKYELSKYLDYFLL